MAVVLVLVALGAIGLATLGAAADRGPGATFVGSTLEMGEEEAEPPPSQPDFELPTDLQQPPEPRSGGSGHLPLILLIVAGTALAGLALWVVIRMRRLARPAPPLAAEPAEEELTAQQALAALEDARSHLSTVVNAHDAVIAAWLALERAIAEAGVTRHPSRTTLEFVVEVLGTLDLDRGSLDRLAHLYRRALFDPEPLGEPDRDEALDLLDHLTTGLDRESAGGPR
ncbi:DUF4129 domain-containing protein [Brachybacterium alimentarium]|uniref:DUF4129 domain-containing protein n=1 Tax=Brachybacterium alimentarium TaxID=47845 RepID=UPI003FD09DD8